MEAISWAFRPVLESIHPQEPQVTALRDSIASTLTTALIPVRQYITKVQAYETWLAVDPTAYVDTLQVSNAIHSSVLSEVTDHSQNAESCIRLVCRVLYQM